MDVADIETNVHVDVSLETSNYYTAVDLFSDTDIRFM